MKAFISMFFQKYIFPVGVVSVALLVLVVANSVNNVSTVIDSNGCSLPNHPIHGRWAVTSNSSNYEPKETIKHGGVDINVTCNERYKLNGSSTLTCNNGTWSEEIGQCLELCPPLVDTFSNKVTCTTNEQSSDCNTPTSGTIATVECAPFYKKKDLGMNTTIVCINGTWNEEIPDCTPVCGLVPSSKSGILERMHPWNVLIYRINVLELGPLCAGTLIDEKTIVTAASCVTDYENFVFPNYFEQFNYFYDLIVAVGKTVEKYENPDPDQEVQYSFVQDVFVPMTFHGTEGKLYSDIAILIAGNRFKMTSQVYPACINWSIDWEDKDFSHVSGVVVAKVAVPQKSLKFSNPPNNSTEVFEIELNLFSEIECSSFLETRSENNGPKYYNKYFVTKDKYCAENITSTYNAPDCNNRIYQGAGLLINGEFTTEGRYFLMGVASRGSAHNDCYNSTFTLFTKVSDYANFFKQKISSHPIPEQLKLQTSCGIKSVQDQSSTVGENTVGKVDYPWQVAVYNITKFPKILICGGSLISQKVILTAAYCVTDKEGQKQPKKNYMIALGKYYRNFDDTRDSNNSQFSALKEIIVPTEYQGRSNNYYSNIAILISEILFDLSTEVKPICLDWEDYGNQFLKPNITGFVTGWITTQENQSLSDELKDLEISFITKQQCKRNLDDHGLYLQDDNLCFGYAHKGQINICIEGTGSGLVFKDKTDNRYYLAGVVSLSRVGSRTDDDDDDDYSSPESDECSQKYGFYTPISKYIQTFILETVRLYWN